MSTRSEKIAITIATTALATAILALVRRQVEVKMLAKIEEQLDYIKTAHRFADIVENFKSTESEIDDFNNPPRRPQGRAGDPDSPDQEDGPRRD